MWGKASICLIDFDPCPHGLCFGCKFSPISFWNFVQDLHLAMKVSLSYSIFFVSFFLYCTAFYWYWYVLYKRSACVCVDVTLVSHRINNVKQKLSLSIEPPVSFALNLSYLQECLPKCWGETNSCRKFMKHTIYYVVYTVDWSNPFSV